jgi:hypothetical protein
VPIRDGHLRAIARGHLGGVGLDLMVAIEAADDQPNVGRCGVAERHRWAFIESQLLRPKLVLSDGGSMTQFCPEQKSQSNPFG